jgi:hypothetical protein
MAIAISKYRQNALALSGAQWNDFIGEQMRGTPRVLTVERG